MRTSVKRGRPSSISQIAKRMKITRRTVGAGKRKRVRSIPSRRVRTRASGKAIRGVKRRTPAPGGAAVKRRRLAPVVPPVVGDNFSDYSSIASYGVPPLRRAGVKRRGSSIAQIAKRARMGGNAVAGAAPRASYKDKLFRAATKLVFPKMARRAGKPNVAPRCRKAGHDLKKYRLSSAGRMLQACKR